jgi:monothiol glutaredoxin
MVYMKGVPEAPQCGFSAMVVRILDEYGTVSHTMPIE